MNDLMQRLVYVL